MTMPMTNNAALDGGRETVVQFDHLQHVYPGGVEALKDINLSFRKGEIVAIIARTAAARRHSPSISTACCAPPPAR